MDRETRNRIQRATQDARTLLERDYAEQLAGTFDIRLDGTIATTPGGHLDAGQRLVRSKLVTAVEHLRAAGHGKDAVVAYVREAAFTTLNRFVALKMLEARGLVQECLSRGEESSGFKEFCGLAPGVSLLPDGRGYRLYWIRPAGRVTSINRPNFISTMLPLQLQRLPQEAQVDALSMVLPAFHHLHLLYQGLQPRSLLRIVHGLARREAANRGNRLVEPAFVVLALHLLEVLLHLGKVHGVFLWGATGLCAQHPLNRLSFAARKTQPRSARLLHLRAQLVGPRGRVALDAQPVVAHDGAAQTGGGERRRQAIALA